MRRILLIGAMSAVLLGGTACGDDNATTPGAGTSSGTSSAAGNTKAICDEVRKLTTDAGKTLADALGEMALAQAKDDKGAIQAAEQKIAAALKDWATKVGSQASNATDPKVKKDLTDLSNEAQALAGKEKPTAADVDAVRKKAEAACG